jgi:hypothetical protein
VDERRLVGCRLGRSGSSTEDRRLRGLILELRAREEFGDALGDVVAKAIPLMGAGAAARDVKERSWDVEELLQMLARLRIVGVLESINERRERSLHQLEKERLEAGPNTVRDTRVGGLL